MIGCQEALDSPMDIEKALSHKQPEVNELLASLDIAVGVLVSVGGDPQLPLHRFMCETLKMKAPPMINAVRSATSARFDLVNM